MDLNSAFLFWEMNIMFDVQCPHCKKGLTITQRKGLIIQPSIRCAFCHKSIKIREKAALLNSWFLGTILGIMMQVFWQMSLDLIICTVLFVVFFIQPFIDIFYSLEPAEDDFDF